MADGDYPKPLPRPSEESRPFWEAARAHRLVLQKCGACGTFRCPPAGICPRCQARDFEWTEVSGKGTVFSFVTYHRLYHKGWTDELPYTVAVIELAEGPRMVSALTGIGPADVTCDMPVRVVFDDVTAEVTLPKFAPA